MREDEKKDCSLDSPKSYRAVKDCGNMTDVLCKGRKFVQMFISCPPDDMMQDWRSLLKLSARDRENVVKLFNQMIKN